MHNGTTDHWIQLLIDIVEAHFANGYISRAMEKQLLASNRNSAYKGIGKGYLHVLFASIFENNDTICGHAVTYRDEDWENIGGTTCAHLGSGDMSAGGYSEKYLDSVGCMVYVRPSCRTIPSTFIDSAHVLALIAAHELGHAFNLEHCNAGCIMKTRVPWNIYYLSFCTSCRTRLQENRP